MLKKYTDLKNHNKAEFKKFKYYVYTLCEIKNNKKIPFYIGMGKGSRCLDHLFDKTNSKKVIKIQRLLKEKENKISIDILRHGIETKETCEVVEASCIDLMGVKELENLKKGENRERLY